MSTLIAQCPHCKQQFNVQEDWAGQNTSCPSCGKTFTIQIQPGPNSSLQSFQTQMSYVREKSTTSLVLGIIGCIAWLLPILGIPLSIVGLVLGTRKRYRVGIIINIIVLVLSLGNCILGVINQLTMSDKDRWVNEQMRRHW